MVLLAGALLVVPNRTRVRRPAEPADGSRSPRPAVPAAGPGRRAVVVAAAVGAGGLLVFPGAWWAVVPAATAVGVALARRPVRRSASRRAGDRQLVAVYAELLASCLDSGMAVSSALRAVSEVLIEGGSPDPVSSRSTRSADLPPTGPADPRGDAGPLAVLGAVAAMLSLGADPGTAWRMAELDQDLAPLAVAARRSAAGGGGLADAVREHAAQLRQETAAASVRAAGRAAVLMTAPLGLCFLPAFLCLGLAPVVVGLLSQLDIF